MTKKNIPNHKAWQKFGVFIVTYLLWQLPLQASELVTKRVPHLSSEQTRYFSHIHWQRHPGMAISVRLLPGINATGKEAFEIDNLSGKDHHSEVRTLPAALDQLFYQLVENTQFLLPTNEPASYSLQFHIRRYDSLYALGDDNNLLSLGFGHIDRSWSQIFGDDKPARITIVAVLYDEQQQMLMEVPIATRLDACERSGNPMLFSPRVNQTFFNGYATTTSGQAMIAAVNRALIEISDFFKNHPIRGKVLRVEGNDIYINVGSQVLSENEQLQLMYQEDLEFPEYALSRLEVDKTWHKMSRVHALDTFSANVLPGDNVELHKVAKQRTFLSIAGEPVVCQEPKTKEKFTLDMADKKEDHELKWNIVSEQ